MSGLKSEMWNDLIMKKICILIFVLAFHVAGCVNSQSTHELSKDIVVSNKEMVHSCKYISDIHGSSVLYGMFATAGISGARSAAINQAKQLGATHVTIDSVEAVYGSTTVNASAYRCPSPRDTKG